MIIVIYFSDDCKVVVLSKNANPDRETLIESATSSDFTLQVENHKFLVHKDILSKQNVFFQLAISMVSEMNNSMSLYVGHDNPSIFKIFLKFVYTRHVNKKDITRGLMEAAKDFMDEELKSLCENALMSMMSEETAIDLLILGVNIESQILTEKASQFIVDRFELMEKRAEYEQVKENFEALEAICFQIAQTRFNTFSMGLMDVFYWLTPKLFF